MIAICITDFNLFLKVIFFTVESLSFSMFLQSLFGTQFQKAFLYDGRPIFS